MPKTIGTLAVAALAANAEAVPPASRQRRCGLESFRDRQAAHSRTRGPKLQGHVPGAAHLTGGPGYGAIKREVGDPSEPLLKRDLQLHACKIGTDAAVDAETKCGVPVFLPIDHNLVRVGDEAGITIGSWEREQDHLADSVQVAPEDCALRHRQALQPGSRRYRVL